MFENKERRAGAFGRNDPDPNYKSLKLEAYANLLPNPEPAWSNLAVVQERVSNNNDAVLFPIDGNDQYGDCTIAGAAHVITMQAALANTLIIPDSQTVVNTYFKLSGGADSGLNLGDVLNYWTKTGIAGNQILASVEIDPQNWDLVKQAIQFFGGVYIGMKVPANAQQQFSQGTPWTGGRLTRGGHCVVVTDYNADGSGELLTWGNKQGFTQSFWTQCVDEVHAVISQYTSAFDSETTANLINDAKALGQ